MPSDWPDLEQGLIAMPTARKAHASIRLWNVHAYSLTSARSVEFKRLSIVFSAAIN
jgi:hypothetical protein